jgi:catechol 2,3-dioxygenase-like lactoylglutathione lyase family enzyme
MNFPNKIHHIALLVSDLIRARTFYSATLGLQEIKRPDFFIPGIWYQIGDYQLHLMLYKNYQGAAVHPDEATVQPHMSFATTVDEFHPLIDELRAKGVDFITPPARSPEGNWQAFFYDFDHNMLEIIALASP